VEGGGGGAGGGKGGGGGWGSVLLFQSPAKGLKKKQQTQPGYLR